MVRARVGRPRPGGGPSFELVEVLEVVRGDRTEGTDVFTLTGLFEPFKKGFGFVRPLAEDLEHDALQDECLSKGAYVPMQISQRWNIQEGDRVTVRVRAPDLQRGQKSPTVIEIVAISNDKDDDDADGLLEPSESVALPPELEEVGGIRVHGVVVKLEGRSQTKYGFLRAEHSSIKEDLFFHPRDISRPIVTDSNCKSFPVKKGDKAFFKVEARRARGGGWRLMAVDVNFHEYSDDWVEAKNTSRSASHWPSSDHGHMPLPPGSHWPSADHGHMPPPPGNFMDPFVPGSYPPPAWPGPWHHHQPVVAPPPPPLPPPPRAVPSVGPSVRKEKQAADTRAKDHPQSWAGAGETELFVPVSRPLDQGLGVVTDKTDGKTLAILQVKAGVVADWNESNPDQQVVEGDRIVEVNGVAGSIQALVDEIKSNESLMLRVVKASMAKTPAVDAYPREQDAYLREQDAYPQEQDVYPQEQDAYPREQDAYPREQDAYPREQDAYPLEQDAYPREQDADPREQDAYPPEQEEAPMFEAPVTEEYPQEHEEAVFETSYAEDTLQEQDEVEEHWQETPETPIAAPRRLVPTAKVKAVKAEPVRPSSVSKPTFRPEMLPAVEERETMEDEPWNEHMAAEGDHWAAAAETDPSMEEPWPEAGGLEEHAPQPQAKKSESSRPFALQKAWTPKAWTQAKSTVKEEEEEEDFEEEEPEDVQHQADVVEEEATRQKSRPPPWVKGSSEIAEAAPPAKRRRRRR